MGVKNDADGLPIGPRVGLDHYPSFVGKEMAVSDWLTVEQDMITTFGDLTGDVYFIHMNPERAAAETPFGTTIAHGFLSLSLLANFARECLPMVNGISMSLNYGLDRVRFVEPVKCGARIRGRFSVMEVDDSRPGKRMTRLGASVEIDGIQRPALTAEMLSLAFIEAQE